MMRVFYMRVVFALSPTKKKVIFYLEHLNNLEKKLLMIMNEVKNIDEFKILNNEQDLQDLNQL